MTGHASRQAATEQHQQAIATINAMFDQLDELRTARERLTGLAPLGPDDDPLRDAETLLQHATQLNTALDELRTAAIAAAEHRTRSDLAADIGTKTNALFPRPARRPSGPVRLTTTPGADQQEAS